MLIRVRNLVIFEVFGVKFSAKKSIFQTCLSGSPCGSFYGAILKNWFSAEHFTPKTSKIVERTVPDYRKDTKQYIFGPVFRPTVEDHKYCLKSWFFKHHEILNIWTHFIPAIFFLYKTLTYTAEILTSVNPTLESCLMPLFTVSAFGCMALSTIYHTFNCHNENMFNCVLCLDYAGIPLLTIGSIIPFLYYAFHCVTTELYGFNVPYIFIIYAVSMSGYGLFLMIFTQTETFMNPKWRRVRAGAFFLFGFSVMLPLFHISRMYSFDYLVENLKVVHMCLSGLLYTSGMGIYCLRFPEKHFPRVFDIWFHSHNWFHLLVAVAAWNYLETMVKIRESNLVCLGV